MSVCNGLFQVENLQETLVFHGFPQEKKQFPLETAGSTYFDSECRSWTLFWSHCFERMNPNSRKTAKNIELLRSYVIGPYRTHFKFVGCHCIGGPQESSPFSINTFAEFWSGVLTILFDILRRKKLPSCAFCWHPGIFHCRLQISLGWSGSLFMDLDPAFCLLHWLDGTQNMSNFHQLPYKIISQNLPFLGYPGCWWKISQMWFGQCSMFFLFPMLGWPETQQEIIDKIWKNEQLGKQMWKLSEPGSFLPNCPNKTSIDIWNKPCQAAETAESHEKVKQKGPQRSLGLEVGRSRWGSPRRNTFRCLPWLIWIKKQRASPFLLYRYTII